MSKKEQKQIFDLEDENARFVKETKRLSGELAVANQKLKEAEAKANQWYDQLLQGQSQAMSDQESLKRILHGISLLRWEIHSAQGEKERLRMKLVHLVNHCELVTIAKGAKCTAITEFQSSVSGNAAPNLSGSHQTMGVGTPSAEYQLASGSKGGGAAPTGTEDAYVIALARASALNMAAAEVEKEVDPDGPEGDITRLIARDLRKMAQKFQETGGIEGWRDMP